MWHAEWQFGGMVIAAMLSLMVAPVAGCDGSIAGGDEASNGAPFEGGGDGTSNRDPDDLAMPSPTGPDGATLPNSGDPDGSMSTGIEDAGVGTEPMDAAEPVDPMNPTDPTDPPGPKPWPDATNTGVPSGTALTPSGGMTITTSGQVIDKLDVSGTITVKANNVTIQNTRIRVTNKIAIELASGYSNLTIKDVTIEGTDTSTGYPQNAAIRIPSAAKADPTVTIQRLNLSGYGFGIFLEDGSGLIEDSYLHDMHNQGGKSRDAIEMWDNHDFVIRHNVVEMDGDSANSAIKFPCDVSWNTGGDNVLVENNILAGGGFALIAGYCPGQPQQWTNTRVVGNHFSTKFAKNCGFYGPASWVQSSLASGNVWHETGKPLQL
ncbi:MAG: hypothetical protein KC417_13960 [Myxococcales bacterium]|nr:hypothetical protein [Myxococcales bacterium]